VKVARRFVATVVLLLSTVGIVCCSAGIIGIWMLHQAAHGKVENITSRLDGALQRASVANQNVQRALQQARASVEKVSKESAAVGGSDEKGRRVTRALRSLVQKQVEPNINDLDGRLATLSDVAAVVSSLLQSFQDFPPFWTGRMRPDKLEGWTDQAEQLAATLRRLENVLGDGDKDGSGPEIAAASSAVDLALQRCQARLDEWQSELEDARESVRYLKSEIFGWVTPAASVVTLLFVWVAVGQISLFVHGVRLWRR
jgi:hypothetical protein